MNHNHSNPARDRYNSKIPPGWDPRYAKQYTLREWKRDLEGWITLTDLKAQQIVPAIISQLSGAARELARSHHHEMIHCGIVNGQPVSALEFLLHKIDSHFALFDEENKFLVFQGIRPPLY